MLKIDLPKDYNTEDLTMLLSVAEQLGIEIKSAVYPLPGQFKVVKGTVTCQLCHTVTIQLMKVSKYSNGVWMKERDFKSEEVIEEEKLLQAQSVTAKVRACWACEGVLMQKEKIDLVKMIMNFSTPVMNKREIWKHIQEIRSAAVAEATQRNKREARGDRDEED